MIRKSTALKLDEVWVGYLTISGDHVSIRILAKALRRFDVGQNGIIFARKAKGASAASGGKLLNMTASF